MPPARVLIFSDPELEAELMQIDPRVAIDLPLRVLTYESVPDGESRVIFNSFDHLRSRYGLEGQPNLAGRFDLAMSVALRGIAPARLLLFGGPALGAKAMAKAPTLGLDAFCQKLLVWQDDAGEVFVSFNDLLVLAARQGVPKSVALRIIDSRLQSVFGSALESE